MEIKKGYYNTAILLVKDKSKIETTKIELKKLQEKTLNEDGCSIFSVQQSKDNASIFLLWERFENENAFQLHFELAHTKNYMKLNLTEVTHFYQTNLI